MTRDAIRRMVEAGRKAGLAHLKADAALPEDFPMRALLVEQARRLETARERSRGETGYAFPGAPRVRREAAWLEALCLRAMGFGRTTCGGLVRKALEAEADIRDEVAIIEKERRA